MSSNSLSDNVFKSTVLSGLASLKSELAEVKSDLRRVEQKQQVNNNQPQCAVQSHPCLLYLCLSRAHDFPLGKNDLQILLGCAVEQYVLLKSDPTATYQVKILQQHLQGALSNARTSGCFIDLWRPRSSVSRSRGFEHKQSQVTKQVATPTSLKITCWNCRGLSNSTQYLNELISDGSDVIILSEHWLWPFELHRLKETHPDFMGWGQADSRLTSTSDSTRGCGGVGVIWRRDLCGTTIPESGSDCICGIRIKIKDSQQFLSIIAVYLPCADLCADYYCECIVELERITEESKQLGPTIIMGDFNAHLGTLGGPQGHGDPNSQGVLLHELLQRCDLFAATILRVQTTPSGGVTLIPSLTMC